ncbi:glucitol operon activator protein [Cricetibacter osteomyelitidis]|uniref:Glucitol operon activator protein n=1 Tax=Cricetibacter osteomyelitidis TaxID=1521931 RepID=A0A4R2T2P6_9PAST|nr:transcriptional regulator GutM [Cricetibacter osteomyelitidis]TCP96500.1 glucitol operon activator protein [Cricetibacter osteomyelitidis]
MNTINALIVIAVIAWILQIILGWWQITRFNKAFEQLCKLGKVGVGRTAGRFKPKVVIAVAFDKNQRVTGSLLMKGYTVFARPEQIPALLGLLHGEIIPAELFPNKPAYQEALAQAIHLQ